MATPGNTRYAPYRDASDRSIREDQTAACLCKRRARLSSSFFVARLDKSGVETVLEGGMYMPTRGAGHGGLTPTASRPSLLVSAPIARQFACLSDWISCLCFLTHRNRTNYLGTTSQISGILSPNRMPPTRKTFKRTLPTLEASFGA